MPELPNPFAYSALEPAMVAEPAAAPDLTDRPVAAAARFVLDADRFLADIEPAPLFLSAPRAEFLNSTDLIPVLQVLAGY